MLRWVLRRVFFLRFTYQMGDTMTGQKQAPYLNIRQLSLLLKGYGHYGLADGVEALAKQRDELAADRDKWFGIALENKHLIKKSEAERDQALASVGAVIEKAANLMADWWNHPGGLDGTPAEIVLTINPDATAALNEMLADAWVEGYDAACKDDCGSNGYAPNPYRKS